MKILIYSPTFYPNIGGLEIVISILAHEFVKQGHTVKLVSLTPACDDDDFPFEIIRFPSPLVLLNLFRWCDVLFQGNVSLKGIWSLFLSPKPLVLSHHGWYCRPNGKIGWQDRLKYTVMQFATNISVSQAVSCHIPVPSVIIPNPYLDTVFRRVAGIPREIELAFLGRLVSDKGVDLLLKALVSLNAQGLTPKLTIIGDGPEMPTLRQMVVDLEIKDQVDFVGLQSGEALVQLLNTHQILVVPSRWQEPFGIVALEGIACGCVVVGSEGGGLKEAIGPCGVTFPNGNVAALTQILATLLKHPDQQSAYRIQATDHLARHTPSAVAAAYLEVFEEALRKHGR